MGLETDRNGRFALFHQSYEQTVFVLIDDDTSVNLDV